MRLRSRGDFSALLLQGDQFLEAILKFIVIFLQVNPSDKFSTSCSAVDAFDICSE